jgi:hypothetical protein
VLVEGLFQTLLERLCVDIFFHTAVGWLDGHRTCSSRVFALPTRGVQGERKFTSACSNTIFGARLVAVFLFG